MLKNKLINPEATMAEIVDFNEHKKKHGFRRLLPSVFQKKKEETPSKSDEARIALESDKSCITCLHYKVDKLTKNKICMHLPRGEIHYITTNVCYPGNRGFWSKKPSVLQRIFRFFIWN